MNLDNLKLFQCIIEKGSMAAAGRAMGLAATTVSERVAALEAHYGVSLLRRTTRSLSLTEEGRMLLEGSGALLTEAEALENRIRFGAETLSGHLRISTPVDLGKTMVTPVIDTFLETNPHISIELLLADGYVSLVEERIDIAVRFGQLSDSTFRVKHLGENRRVVCASPSYLNKHGTPQMPTDLVNHNCLLMRFGPHLDQPWTFQVHGKSTKVMVKGNRIANDGRLVRQWCVAGLGIALKSYWDVKAELASGTLKEILAPYAPKPNTVQILLPPSPTQPRRVQEFTKCLVEAFRIGG